MIKRKKKSLQKSIVFSSIIDEQIIQVKVKFLALVSVILNVTKEISCIKKEVCNLRTFRENE